MMKHRKMVDGALVETAAEAVQFEERVDVLVAGVGSAGAIAVIAASAQGASVLGVDRLPGIGGMGTMGYVHGYYYGLPGGLHVDIDEEAQQMGREHFLSRVEAKKYIMENRITAHGARLALETSVSGVYLDGQTVKGVSLFCKGRQWNVACHTLIDATADAIVSMLAGSRTHIGRESDGKTRPFTSVKVWLTKSGTLTRTNHDSGYVDQYDPLALSRGILQAHASQLLEEFRDEAKRVLFFAPFIGVREGRIIETEHRITMQEVVAGVREEEVLFYGYSDFDKHGKDNVLESDELQDLYVAANLSTACFSVPVTLRAMTPKGFKGLLAAGRHIGMDHDVASLLRMQRDMQKCGESAGVVAALAARRGVDVSEVPYPEVRDILTASGSLTAEHDKGILFDDSFRREPIRWMTDADEMRAALATDMPGVAIYSAKLLGSRIAPQLREWIGATDAMLRYGAAIALGMTGDRAAAPVLREIVERRDALYFKDCRRTNQFRSAIAIYLLGRLGDADSVPLLTDILCDEDEYAKPLYHEITEPSYKINASKNFNELYFQIISHAAMALIRIARAHPDQAAAIKERLRAAFGDDRHLLHVTTLPKLTYEYETVDNVRAYVLAFCEAKEQARTAGAAM
ncbi:FAD-dependent oxidoreductase [Paenibacillus sp. IB182496]|uniref:FAD-dependent oxidoreductase n=1 Tax=Paenibacillus sabuli TaxID=2772509 RepID=A0A927BW60_9BACL|nr:FAD-dependent oxidoreductase [Paenibacillus sabuli]MBD2846604.1 FAD-dependent oxidoreductase [Paenibacillus sabuli]